MKLVRTLNTLFCLGLGLCHVTANADSLLNLPIMVEADEFEIRMDLEHAVWRGNVVAQQGNYAFRAGSLSVSLEQVGQSPEGSGSGSGDNTRNNAYTLSAQHLSYDVGAGTISGEGDSEIRRGQESIRANRITYYVNERKALALPEPNGRVFVQFYNNPDTPIFPSAGLTVADAAD